MKDLYLHCPCRISPPCLLDEELEACILLWIPKDPFSSLRSCLPGDDLQAGRLTRSGGNLWEGKHQGQLEPSLFSWEGHF